MERRHFESPAALWFDIENVAYGCDYTGANQHPVYILRRREGT
jgi:hypothetical protein